MKVKPAIPGAMIRDPHTKRPLPAEGDDVPESNFWIRRLLDGSVVRVEEAAPRGNDPITPLATRGGK